MTHMSDTDHAFLTCRPSSQVGHRRDRACRYSLLCRLAPDLRPELIRSALVALPVPPHVLHDVISVQSSRTKTII